MRGRVAGVVIFMLSLAGCATLSEEECLAGDWVSIGAADGAAGRMETVLSEHAKACGEVGVAPDEAAWRRGYEDGLIRYCTPQNAYEQGRMGQSLRPVCPSGNAAALQEANWTGRRYYDIGQDIADVERQLSDIRVAMAGLAADAPNRAILSADYSRLSLELTMLRTQRLLYATAP